MSDFMDQPILPQLLIMWQILLELTRYILCLIVNDYYNVSNIRGGENKQGGGAKVVKSINVEEEINVDRV